MESVTSLNTPPTSQGPWCLDPQVTRKIFEFLPPQAQTDVKSTCRTFEAALKIEDKKVLTPFKSLEQNLAELVEREDSECPEEITTLSREISAILENPSITFSHKEAQIFIKLLKLSVASFAYLYTKFNMEEGYYFEKDPSKPDKINAAYAYVQDPNHPHTILVQAQFYRGIAMDYISEEQVSDLVIKELAQKGQLHLAKVLFDSINGWSKKNAFASRFSLYLAQADRPGAALKVAHYIDDLSLKLSILKEIAKSFARVGGLFEHAYKTMRAFTDSLGTQYAVSSQSLVEMANILLTGERLDLMLDFFSYYLDRGAPNRTIPIKVYQNVLAQFNKNHQAYQHNPECTQKDDEDLEAWNRALLTKVQEMIPLAESGEHAPVDQWLSGLEQREDRKLCSAHLAIQLHMRGFRDAASHYVALIN